MSPISLFFSVFFFLMSTVEAHRSGFPLLALCYPTNFDPPTSPSTVDFRSAENRFRLVHDDGSSTSSRYKRCIGAVTSSSSVTLVGCGDKGAIWWRYLHLMINLVHEKCLYVKPGSSVPRLGECDLSDVRMMIGVSPSHHSFDVDARRNEPFQFTVGGVKLSTHRNRGELHAEREAADQWRSISAPGEKPLRHHFAVQRSRYCRTPVDGRNSFVVRKSLNPQSLMHVWSRQLVEHLKKSTNSCMEVGETVMTACRVGHVSVDSGSNSRVLTCTGNDQFDRSSFFHCRKIECPKPKIRDHYHYEVMMQGGTSYQDEVLYICKPQFADQIVSSVCTANGVWSVPPPNCQPLCTEELRKRSGYITTPDYPRDYRNDILCRWRIVAPRGEKIALWFRDFRIESGFYSHQNCKFDYITVQDSDTTTRFCGIQPLEVYYSKKNKLIIGFSADDSYGFRGFLIQYTMWNPRKRKMPVEPKLNHYWGRHDLDYPDSLLRFEQRAYAITIIFTVLITIALLAMTFVVCKHLVTVCKRWCLHLATKKKEKQKEKEKEDMPPVEEEEKVADNRVLEFDEAASLYVENEDT